MYVCMYVYIWLGVLLTTSIWCNRFFCKNFTVVAVNVLGRNQIYQNAKIFLPIASKIVLIASIFKNVILLQNHNAQTDIISKLLLLHLQYLFVLYSISQSCVSACPVIYFIIISQHVSLILFRSIFRTLQEVLYLLAPPDSSHLHRSVFVLTASIIQ